MFTKRALALAAGLGIAASAGAHAQQIGFFRIATGATAGTYYPIGSLIAHAISAPPGAPGCTDGLSCGVPGLVVSALASSGSVENVAAIQSGAVESGFVQGDVAARAFAGDGPWQGKAPADKLRVIANLYPESIHLVVRADAGIATLADLRGKRVSLDEPGSGTLVEARLILKAAGLTETDMQPANLTLHKAATELQQGKLDAFFFTGGYPAGAIAELAGQTAIRILPIDGPLAAKLTAEHRYFTRDQIPAETYQGQTEPVTTLSVGAQWLTSADQPEALIHDITKALWSENTRQLLVAGHAKGHAITADDALAGVAVPLHPGAARFYREVGLLN